MRKLIHVKYLLLIMLTAFIVSCQGNANKNGIVETGYKTLSALGTTYDSSMKALSSAHKSGLVSDQDFKDIKSKYAIKFYNAYHVAVDALHEYSVNPNDKTRATWESNLALVQTALEFVVKLAEPFITK